MKKKWTLWVLGVFALGVLGYFYVFQKHRDIQSETAEYTTTATLLLSDFINNAEVATLKYLNKTVEIHGVVSQSDSLTFMLDQGIFFALSEKRNLPVGAQISAKGRCIGYDDLLGEVKIDQAYILTIKSNE
ncbi:MAG: hypothetical protein ACI828_000248 [Flavobacteriales bacterium]|jgi:hypothetical protein